MPVKAPPKPPTLPQRLIGWMKKNPKAAGVLFTVLSLAAVFVARAEIALIMETSHEVCTAGKTIEFRLRTEGWSVPHLVFGKRRDRHPKATISRLAGTLKSPIEVVELNWNAGEKVWAAEWECASDPLPALFSVDAGYLKHEALATFTVVSAHASALSRRRRPNSVSLR